MILTTATFKRLSVYGFCVNESDLFNINSQKHMKKKFIESHDLYVYRDRVYTPVKFQSDPSLLFWMDCITGTLFNKNGVRSNSKLKINMRNLVKDKDAGAKILMSKKFSLDDRSEVHSYLMSA